MIANIVGVGSSNLLGKVGLRWWSNVQAAVDYLLTEIWSGSITFDLMLTTT